MKRIRNILIFSNLLFFTVVAFGQSDSKIDKQFEKARKYSLIHNYDAAIKEANKILYKHPDYVNASLLLADIYNEINSTEFEIASLKKASEYSDNPAISYRLAEANYSIGFYDNAIIFYEKYLQTVNVPEVRKNEVRRKIENCEFAIDAKKHPVKFQPKRLNDNINTANDEYWPSLSVNQKQLVFTRLIKIEGQIPHEDFYVSNIKSNEWRSD